MYGALLRGGGGFLSAACIRGASNVKVRGWPGGEGESGGKGGAGGGRRGRRRGTAARSCGCGRRRPAASPGEGAGKGIARFSWSRVAPLSIQCR